MKPRTRKTNKRIERAAFSRFSFGHRVIGFRIIFGGQLKRAAHSRRRVACVPSFGPIDRGACNTASLVRHARKTIDSGLRRRGRTESYVGEGESSQTMRNLGERGGIGLEFGHSAIRAFQRKHFCIESFERDGQFKAEWGAKGRLFY